jgi:hypothetical protein
MFGSDTDNLTYHLRIVNRVLEAQVQSDLVKGSDYTISKASYLDKTSRPIDSRAYFIYKMTSNDERNPTKGTWDPQDLFVFGTQPPAKIIEKLTRTDDVKITTDSSIGGLDGSIAVRREDQVNKTRIEGSAPYDVDELIQILKARDLQRQEAQNNAKWNDGTPPGTDKIDTTHPTERYDTPSGTNERDTAHQTERNDTAPTDKDPTSP